MRSVVLEFMRRLHFFLRRRRFEAELREEMDAHREMLAEESDPVSARRRFGNLTRWQEMSREVWMWNWLESFTRDVGYDVRLLLKSPGFTLTACLSLAVGLGATMGIFSLINALILKTLPVPQAKQLWELSHKAEADRDDHFSYPMFDALERANSLGSPLFAIGGDYVDVNYGTTVRNTPALIVSGEAFRILKLKPRIGRLLTPEDDISGVPHGANCVLSYRLWQSQFHGDVKVLGKQLSIGAQS